MKTLRIAIAALALCAVQGFHVWAQGTIASPQADAQLKAMENKFFEHDFSKESEEYRLQRLEKFAFGQTSVGTLDARLGRLTKVIDLHPNLVQQPKPVVQTMDDAPKSAHDAMKWVEDYKPKQPIVEPMQTVVGDEDTDIDDTAMMEPPASQKPAANADPILTSDTPPSPNARLLTRVAWCEQHVFKKTFPQLHLTARLHQLNAELFPQDREPDIKLMDRIDLIVREVVMQEHPPIAYSAPQ